ncbi:hypothetical protein DFH94DRAFT_688745 [Russula ochroleuca]|uniref:Transmembrane protein n=1 Tax=Russula ochroleuca TaxID=152965 RepID=A0A9P5MK41_9AGAM|nr:hypothetical protein DFH94DRAFT_699897 [Russula ochroleuca]KAF8486378.1 hypothetical protein DFH94DRAFT_688745 [Russula ochroleuca]
MPTEVVVYGHLMKIVHLFGGIYFWEVVTTLDFEWEIFTGKRPWRWSFVVYLTARLLCLGAVILNLIGYDVTSELNCNAWLRTVLVMSWFSVAIASFLLALRGIAIWGRDKMVITVALLCLSANIGVSFYSSTESNTVWNQQAKACAVTGTSSFRWSILTNLIVDLTLLSIMFVGVMRKKNATRLWRILYFQGIFWIMTAIATEVPCVILPFMNMSGVSKLFGLARNVLVKSCPSMDRHIRCMEFVVPNATQFVHLPCLFYPFLITRPLSSITVVLMVTMSTRLYRDLFQYITNDHYTFDYRRPKFLPQQNVQVAVHKTVEVDVDLRHLDEEQLRSGFMQTVSMRSQAELEIIAAELQMKNDLRI